MDGYTFRNYANPHHSAQHPPEDYHERRNRRGGDRREGGSRRKFGESIERWRERVAEEGVRDPNDEMLGGGFRGGYPPEDVGVGVGGSGAFGGQAGTRGLHRLPRYTEGELQIPPFRGQGVPLARGSGSGTTTEMTEEINRDEWLRNREMFGARFAPLTDQTQTGSYHTYDDYGMGEEYPRFADTRGVFVGGGGGGGGFGGYGGGFEEEYIGEEDENEGYGRYGWY